MTDLAAPLDQAALAELMRRRANAGKLVAANQLPRAEAEALVRRWCGIAAWFGAVLPVYLRPWPELQCWTDHKAEAQPQADWRREIAEELRRAATVALDAHQAAPEDDAKRTRAGLLIRLDWPLARAAGLDPFPLTLAQARELDRRPPTERIAA